MPFQPGDRVRLRTDRLRIGVVTRGPTSVADTYQYHVQFGSELKWIYEQDLELVSAEDPGILFIERSFSGRDSILRLVTYNRLTKPFADTLLTLHASKIDYLPYQWLPLLRLLNTSDQRMLIADEVGLGKTIEAGIIHRELSARTGGLKRVLIVARTGELNRQWEGELRERFAEGYEFWDSQKFVEWITNGEREQYWDSIHAIVGRHTFQKDRKDPSKLSMDDIKWSGFLPRLINDVSSDLPNPGKRLWEHLTSEIQTLIREITSSGGKPDKSIINALNKILDKPNFYDQKYFSYLELPNEANNLLSKRKDLTKKEIRRFNRLLIETSYPYDIANSLKKDSHELQKDTAFSSILKVCTIDGKGEHFKHPNIDIDLLIVDESHHTRNPNNLHKAIHWLAQCAKSVIFLTATPIHLRNDDLYNQLKILFPKRFANKTFFQDELRVHQIVLQAIRQLNAKDVDNLRASLNHLANGEDISDLLKLLDDIEKPSDRARLKQQIESFSPLANVINRTTRRDIPNIEWPQRNAITVEHSLTEKEKKLYSQLIIQHYEAVASGLPFGKTTALRLAATCMPVAMSKHGLNLIEEEWDDESTDERGEKAIAEPGQLDLEYLARRHDSRFEQMWEALEGIWRETPESKIIIFSFFVDVLDYLSKRLKNLGIVHVVVHGRDPHDRSEREVRYDDFKNNPEIRLLLSSEVGTEGLNLQVADTIVNYNLPWNPMVVEQRIGRIDRKGQKSPKIRIVNLFAEGTIEDKVIRRLLDRIRIFQASIGDLEPILGEIEKKIAKEFLDPNLSDVEIRKRADALGSQLEIERLNRQQLEEAAREQLIADLPFDPVEKAMEEGRYTTDVSLFNVGRLEGQPRASIFASGVLPEAVVAYNSAEDKDAFIQELRTAITDILKQALLDRGQFVNSYHKLLWCLGGGARLEKFRAKLLQPKVFLPRFKKLMPQGTSDLFVQVPALITGGVPISANDLQSFFTVVYGLTTEYHNLIAIVSADPLPVFEEPPTWGELPYHLQDVG